MWLNLSKISALLISWGWIFGNESDPYVNVLSHQDRTPLHFSSLIFCLKQVNWTSLWFLNNSPLNIEAFFTSSFESHINSSMSVYGNDFGINRWKGWGVATALVVSNPANLESLGERICWENGTKKNKKKTEDFGKVTLGKKLSTKTERRNRWPWPSFDCRSPLRLPNLKVQNNTSAIKTSPTEKLFKMIQKSFDWGQVTLKTPNSIRGIGSDISTNIHKAERINANEPL